MILANAKVNVGYTSGPLEGLIEVKPNEPPEGLFAREIFNNLARCLGAKPVPTPAPFRPTTEDPSCFISAAAAWIEPASTSGGPCKSTLS